VLSVLARDTSSRWPDHWTKWFWILPAASSGIVAFASAYDEWRTISFIPFDPGAYWMSLTDPVPWLRSCAPELLGLITFAIQPFALRVRAGLKNLNRTISGVSA
jgi:hypothetical protein